MPISITEQEKAILQKVVIPPRPEALLKISEEGKKPEPDVGKIAQAITEDVSISASVLQVVNSAAFRRSKEIESIQQAVMTLGFKRLLPLVKSVALKSSMGESEKLATFWEQATKIATAASVTAEMLNKPSLKDHSYMLGLFHNAGITILLLANEDYSEILQMAEEHGWPSVTDEERGRYGTCHTTISALLGQRWKLPPVMSEVIYYQFDVEGLYSSGELPSIGLDLMSILKLARHVVFGSSNSESEDPEWVQVEDDILHRFDLTEEELENLIEQNTEQLAA